MKKLCQEGDVIKSKSFINLYKDSSNRLIARSTWPKENNSTNISRGEREYVVEKTKHTPSYITCAGSSSGTRWSCESYEVTIRGLKDGKYNPKGEVIQFENGAYWGINPKNIQLIRKIKKVFL